MDINVEIDKLLYKSNELSMKGISITNKQTTKRKLTNTTTDRKRQKLSAAAQVKSKLIQLCNEHGVQVLRKKWLCSNNKSALYDESRQKGVKFKQVAEACEVLDEYIESRRRDTKEECIKKLKLLFEEKGGKDGGGEKVLFGTWLNKYDSTFYNLTRHHKIKLVDIAKKWNVGSKVEKLRSEISHATQEKYTKQELLKLVKDLYAKDGIQVLTDEYLFTCKVPYKHFPQKSLVLKHALGNERLFITNIVSELLPELPHLADEREEYLKIHRRVPHGRQKWTRPKFLEITEMLLNKYNRIPHKGILQHENLGSYESYMYQYGYTKESIYAMHGLHFEYTCRLGWLRDSQAEVFVGDYLFARNVEQRKGQKYPENYADYGEFHSAIYDGHFLGQYGKWKDVWIAYEIWGDNPAGRGEVYAKRRKQKELFHKKENIFFLSIHWEKCEKEKNLEDIFRPFLGVLPVVKGSEEDKHFDSNLWSFKDIVLAECKKVQQHYGTIPLTAWFLRRKEYKYRVQNRWEFELRYAMSTLLRKIEKIGGIRKVRKILKCKVISDYQNKKRKRDDDDIIDCEVGKIFEEVVMTELTTHHLPIVPIKGNGPRKKKAKITKEMVEKKLGEIYDVHGLEGITPKWLKSNGHYYMHGRMRKELGMTCTTVAKTWGIIDKDKNIYFKKKKH
tara:strand:- start:1356 stop:3374 length:2019 start_codon:yes stop_codon:yes gene_type:complete